MNQGGVPVNIDEYIPLRWPPGKSRISTSGSCWSGTSIDQAPLFALAPPEHSGFTLVKAVLGTSIRASSIGWSPS